MGRDAAARMVFIVAAARAIEEGWRRGIGSGDVFGVADEGDASGVGQGEVKTRKMYSSNDAAGAKIALVD
ncbi:MAG: hypothetical protein JO119_19050 [Acidobacteria bacterium]|nr:hypothetical protein [Acidobacteriota bacterium]